MRIGAFALRWLCGNVCDPDQDVLRIYHFFVGRTANADQLRQLLMRGTQSKTRRLQTFFTE